MRRWELALVAWIVNAIGVSAGVNAYAAGLITTSDDPGAFLVIVLGWGVLVGGTRVLVYYRPEHFPSAFNIVGNVLASMLAGSIASMLSWSLGHTDPMRLLGSSLLVGWFGVDGLRWMAGRVFGTAATRNIANTSGDARDLP